VPKDQKQHYIPQFYQRQWAGADGRLCEYCLRHTSVKARMCYPAGSGYQPGLYTIRNVPQPIADHTENVFLSKTDSEAAEALRLLLLTEPYVWTAGPRSAWTRFVMSLMHRTPERVEHLRATIEREYPKLLAEFQENYASMKQLGDPDTFEEYKARMGPNPSGRATALLLQKIMDSKTVGEHLNHMTWHVLTFGNAPQRLLTSDRPIMMTNGLTGADAHIAMPISPRHIFLAVNDNRVLRAIQAMDPNDVLHNNNDRVTSQAKKYVYGIDDSQLAFVEPRLGLQLPSTPFETASR
jgi:Protein of unknown function (DUF4238)